MAQTTFINSFIHVGKKKYPPPSFILLSSSSAATIVKKKIFHEKIMKEK